MEDIFQKIYFKRYISKGIFQKVCFKQGEHEYVGLF